MSSASAASGFERVAVRALGLVGLVATLLATAPRADAVTIRMQGRQVGVDTRALIQNPATGTSQDKNPPLQTSNAAVSQVALNVFLKQGQGGFDLETGDASGTGFNFLIPVIDRIVWTNSVSIHGKLEPGENLEGMASSRTFGEASFMLGTGDWGLLLDLQFTQNGDNFDFSRGFMEASLVIENVTKGTLLFDSDLFGFPGAIPVFGISGGDLLRLRYETELFLELSEVPAGGSIGLNGTVRPIPVPEASGLLLLAAGLGLLAGIRRRDRRPD